MNIETYRLIVWGWMALGAVVFLALHFIRAPFGRHTTGGWGPTMDNHLGWVLMEATVLVVFFLFLRQRWPETGSPVALMAGLFVAHYVHRSLIFPWFLRTRGKRMPLLIALSAMCFNTMNGFLLGYYFAHFAEYQASWFSDPRFIAGTLLFLGGAALNVLTDYRLIRLRKPGETGYVIPSGGLFEWVSCPNLLGEIIEWIGFALLSWSLPGLAFAFWTIANLAPRAWAHHRWYHEKFRAYPANRKALIPFIW